MVSLCKVFLARGGYLFFNWYLRLGEKFVNFLMVGSAKCLPRKNFFFVTTPAINNERSLTLLVFLRSCRKRWSRNPDANKQYFGCIVNEYKTAKSLGVVMIAFVICWTPFFIFSFLYTYCVVSLLYTACLVGGGGRGELASAPFPNCTVFIAHLYSPPVILR